VLSGLPVFRKERLPQEFMQPRMPAKRQLSQRPRHSDNRQRFAIRERQFDAFLLDIAIAAVERDPGKRRTHLKPRKALGASSFFAQRKNAAADALPGPRRMDKESADSGRIAARIEQRIVAARTVIAPVRRPAARPAAARDEDRGIRDGLHGEIGAVG